MTTEMIVVEENSGALILSGQAAPAQVVARAREAAVLLAAVVKDCKLTTKISGRDYVRVEGWQTLGAMLGLFTEVEWTRKTDFGWEARAIARAADGRVISAGEASCDRDEDNWSKRPDFALRSMAQTRACGKALRNPLAWIMSLAGYEGTPAEEMPPENRPLRHAPINASAKAAPAAKPSGDYNEAMYELGSAMKELGLTNTDLLAYYNLPDASAFTRYIQETAKSLGETPAATIRHIIELLPSIQESLKLQEGKEAEL